ncbi:hypothetical protein [Brevundimonas basaltis]|uniref:MFS family permease n=2 Tax=Brevundimonas basaltis TaxID=472166 RepID=A0A7W8HW99_9CAUL|nr:MFS family permease [Brevundimonas basaltis]
MATMIWGLVLLAPTALAFAAIIPMLTELMASGAFENGPGPDHVSPFDDDFAAMMQFQIWSQLANIAQLFAVLLVTTAIIRAVFASRRGDSAAHLRIGMQELYVAVIGVTVGIGMVITVVAAVLLAVAIGLALGGTPEPWRSLIYFGMGIGLAVGFLALWGRLALLAPACLRYNTFAFVEGWKLGRGQTWRLLALMIVMFFVALVLCAVLFTVILVAAMFVGGGMAAMEPEPEAVQAWFEGLQGRPLLLIGGGILLLLPVAWVHGFCQLLGAAPFARAVLDLAPDVTPNSAISADTALIDH